MINYLRGHDIRNHFVAKWEAEHSEFVSRRYVAPVLHEQREDERKPMHRLNVTTLGHCTYGPDNRKPRVAAAPLSRYVASRLNNVSEAISTSEETTIESTA